MSNKPVYFPGLNGLRAIAALAVVLSHTTQSLDEFNLNPHIFGTHQNGDPKGINLGAYGVTIFFVLSGFLITYLLLLEKAIQPINIRKFYIRRILRIWPLYYLYLSLAVITTLIVGLDLNLKSLFFYTFYAANIPFILDFRLPFLGHFWSLGVEEQFYLFWPWVNKKINSLLGIIIIAIIVLIGTKVFLHFFYPGSIWEKVIEVTRFHSMMIGAVGAILYKKGHSLFLKITDNKLTQGICWIIILLIAINKFHIASVIDGEIVSFVALLLIIGQVSVKNRVVNLEVKALNFLGKISYGIYVIHPLLIFLLSKLITGEMFFPLIKYISVYFFVTGTTILLSYLSYNYFEKYFLNFKKKFEVVESSGA